MRLQIMINLTCWNLKNNEGRNLRSRLGAEAGGQGTSVIFQNLLEIHKIYDIMCIKMLEEVQK